MEYLVNPERSLGMDSLWTRDAQVADLTNAIRTGTRR